MAQSSLWPKWHRSVGLAALALSLSGARVRAHDCGAQRIYMRVGDIVTWSITTDVSESQASGYQLLTSVPSIISVSPTTPFTSYVRGTWTIMALAQGTTALAFEWSYAPNNTNGFCSVLITVTNNLTLTGVNYPNSAYTCDPINAFTGGYSQSEEPDLIIKGPLPLVFQRQYGSDLSANLLGPSSLGKNWAHNFESYLAQVSNRVDIVTYQGLRLQFQYNGTAWQPINGQAKPYQLIQSGSNFLLGDRRARQIDTFNGNGQLTSISDLNGNALTLTYSNNVLAQVSDGFGATLTFTYTGFQHLFSVGDGSRTVYFIVNENTPGAPQLLQVLNPQFGVTTYNYDTNQPQNALLVSETHPNGNTHFIQSYDTNQHVVAQAALNYTNKFAFNNGSTTATNPLGHTVAYNHDSGGHLTNYTDETGASVTIQSNTNGQRVAIQDRLAHQTGYAYDPLSGQVEVVTNADGTLTTYAYTNYYVNGLTFFGLSQVTYPDNTTERFVRDPAGNVLTYVDRLGKSWFYTYNSHGQLLTALNPLGGLSTYTYNPTNGTLVSSTDPQLGTNTYSYDNFRRPTVVTYPDGSTSQKAYDNLNHVTQLTDGLFNTTSFFYDPNGNLTNAVDANGGTAQFFYDGLDRLLTEFDRLSNRIDYAYDPLGNVQSVTNRNGNHVSFGYDPRNRFNNFTDADSNNFAFGVDSEGQVDSVVDPMSQTNAMGRNAMGYPTSLTNALGLVSAVGRNSLQLVTAYTDELAHVTQVVYDTGETPTNVTRPQIGAVSIKLNGLGQVQQLTDFNGQSWFWGHSLMGRPQSFRDPLDNTTWVTYDSRGNEALIYYPDGLVRTNSFDAAQNLTNVTYTDGTSLDYSYNALHALQTGVRYTLSYDAEQRVTNTTSWGVNFGASYKGGRLDSVSYNNGALLVHYQYNGRGLVTNISDSLGGGISYSYDTAGYLTGAVRAGITGIYSYDKFHRQTGIQEGSYLNLQRTFGPSGRILQATYFGPYDPSRYVLNVSYKHTYNAAGQINDPGYSYSLRGFQIASPAHTYSWRGPGWLTGVDNISFGYNGMGDLSTRIQGGVTNWNFYNYAFGFRPGLIAGDMNVNSGQYLRYYVRAPSGELAYIRNAQTGDASYPIFDFVGHTLGLLNSSGFLTDTYAYDTYGGLLAHTGTNQQPFTAWGRYNVLYDFSANLYRIGYRWHDPTTASFLSPDPDWPDPGNPQRNRYSFAIDNSLKYFNLDRRLSLSAGLRYTSPSDDIFQRQPSRLSFDAAPIPRAERLNISGLLQNLSPQSIIGPVLPEDYLGHRTPNAWDFLAFLSHLSHRCSCCCCCCCDCCCCCCCCCCDCCGSSRGVSRLESFLADNYGLYSRANALEYRPRPLTQALIKFSPRLPVRIPVAPWVLPSSNSNGQYGSESDPSHQYGRIFDRRVDVPITASY